MIIVTLLPKVLKREAKDCKKRQLYKLSGRIIAKKQQRVKERGEG